MQKINSHLQHATIALQNKDYEKSDIICLKLLKKIPNQVDALHLLALSNKQQNDWDKSQYYFEKSLSINKNQPVVLTNYANLLVKMGIFEQAIETYKKAHILTPSNAEILYNLAALLNQIGQQSRAIKQLDKAIRINDKNPHYFNLLGNCFHNIEQYRHALDSYDKAIELTPSNFYAHHNKGITFRKIQQPAKAVECYLNVYEQGKLISVFLFNLGSAYYDLGQFGKTEELLLKAIDIQPEYVDAHEALNKLYWEHSQQDKFLKSYQTAIVNTNKSAPLHYSYASHLIMAHKEEQAQDILENAIKELGEAPEFMHALAVLVCKKGDHCKALSLFKKAIKNQPENTRFRIDLANFLIQQSKYKSALAQLEFASKIDPLDQEIWAFKGICWRLLGDERDLWLNNYDRFIQAKRLDTPLGYDNFEHFMHEYKAVINKMHRTVQQPLDQSVRGGSQTAGHLLLQPIKVIQDYKTVLSKRIKEYLDSLPIDPNHPFLKRKSLNFSISGCWSVRLNKEGYHTNHVHPRGWLSGPTYINIPDAISANDESKAGWVKFGETSLQLGDREKIALEVCPQPGLCVLFPSYIWHGTHPFNSSEYRTTSPCDIMPQP